MTVVLVMVATRTRGMTAVEPMVVPVVGPVAVAVAVAAIVMVIVAVVVVVNVIAVAVAALIGRAVVTWRWLIGWALVHEELWVARLAWKRNVSWRSRDVALVEPISIARVTGGVGVVVMVMVVAVRVH